MTEPLSKMQLLYGMRQWHDSVFIPMRRMSSRHSGREGLIYYALGPSQLLPSIIENRSDVSVLDHNRDAGPPLEWPARTISAHPGARGEEAVIRLKICLSADYFFVVTTEAQRLDGKPTAISLGLNGKTFWRSAVPDTIAGNIRLEPGDQVDISVGLLPFSDYSESATTVRFGLFVRTDAGELVCVDEQRSGFRGEEISRLAALSRRDFHPNMQPVIERMWHKQAFNTMMRHDDIKHLEACFMMPFDTLFDHLIHRNIKVQKRYVIFFTPRSGSSLLTECVSQMDILGKPLEYFVEHALPVLLQPQIRSDEPTLQTLQKKFSSDNGVFGIEIDYNRYFDAEEPLIDDLDEWLIFYMTRRDILAQAISLHCAANFGLWNVNSVTATAPKYDRTSIVHFLVTLARMMQGFEKYFAQINISPKRIVYEDFIADIDGTMRLIAETLEIDPKKLSIVDLSKTAQRKLTGGSRSSWARDILATGGTYKGYEIREANERFMAVISGADIAEVDRPQDYRPLAFLSDSEAEVKYLVDSYIAGMAR